MNEYVGKLVNFGFDLPDWYLVLAVEPSGLFWFSSDHEVLKTHLYPITDPNFKFKDTYED